MQEIEDFYLGKDEPLKGCLLALRDIILAQHSEVAAEWKYRMPFFSCRGKRFCYLWVDKKRGLPYIGFTDGQRLEHPGLLQEKRSRMKILLVDPEQDLPLEIIETLLQSALIVP